MLGGEDDIFHPGVFGNFCPGVGSEVCRIKSPWQREIVALEEFVVLTAHGPRRQIVRSCPGVLLDDWPRFDAAPLAVNSPMHHEAELLVLKPIEPLLQPRFGVRIRGDNRLCETQCANENYR